MPRVATSCFEIAGGTVTGRSHAISGKSNQDAYAFVERDDVLVAAVCDGCGSSPHSEVGARIGARIVTSLLAARVAEGAAPDAPDLFEGVRVELLASIRALATAMGGDFAETVNEQFLFTVVGFVVTGERGCVFAAGDGIAAIDGEILRFGPFPRNEPPYLAYGLVSRHAPSFAVHRSFDDARALLVGTDGAADLVDLAESRNEVGPMRRLWEDDRYFTNRDALRRWLALLNRDVAKPLWDERRIERRAGLLDDDTTLVVARRKAL